LVFWSELGILWRIFGEHWWIFVPVNLPVLPKTSRTSKTIRKTNILIPKIKKQKKTNNSTTIKCVTYASYFLLSFSSKKGINQTVVLFGRVSFGNPGCQRQGKAKKTMDMVALKNKKCCLLSIRYCFYTWSFESPLQ